MTSRYLINKQSCALCCFGRAQKVARPKHSCALAQHSSGSPTCLQSRLSDVELGTNRRSRGCRLSSHASLIADVSQINVDYVSPAVWLGVFCGVSGLMLYTYKLNNAAGTRDSEIVTASLLGLAGGILAVQGWRLDPILLLSEVVLSSVGVYYIIQTVNLRKELDVRSDACCTANTPTRAAPCATSTMFALCGCPDCAWLGTPGR